VGILEERGAQLELHPLARSFLEEHVDHADSDARSAAVRKCLGHYKSRRDWDAAFDVIAKRGPACELESLIHGALDDLLNSARLSTIQEWCEFASASRIEAPIVALAHAEVSVRHGRHAEAQTFAELAADSGSDVAFRALSVAGRAAHLASREEEALALYKRAEAIAATEKSRRDALWGQLICAVELELPHASDTLAELSAGVRVSDPRDVIRAAAYTLMYQLRLATLDLREADLAWHVMNTVDDPLVASAFQSAYANVLALSARYAEARDVSEVLLSTAQRYRLTFALPYAHCWAGMAHSGLRDWARARECFDQGALTSRASGDVHAEQTCYSALVRSFAHEGNATLALALPTPEPAASLPALRAEVLTSRGLALASAGRVEDAMRLADEARGVSRALEPAVLLAAIDAVCSLKSRRDDVRERIAALESTAFTSGAVDLLVAAYRSTPELLGALLRTSAQPDRLRRLLQQAHDEDLAAALGHSVSAGDPRERLTRREREVYDLLCDGLRNAQIAEALFISESTVKLHVHHIYDKLGTRSRTALAVQAALERSGQATSATGGSEVDVVS
jgi:DNA-binding NarL/FixJ family response regulator